MTQGITRRRAIRTGLGAASMLPLVPAATRRPNIVFLLTDDQRHDTVAALGNPIVQTPNMDSLVRGGVSFINNSIMGGTVSAICTPSRAMLLTGQHLFRAHDNLLAWVEAAG